MAGKVTPELQQAQAATLQAAQAVKAQLTPDEFERMTNSFVSVYDVFVAQKLVTNLTSDGTPDPDDPATKLWAAVNAQSDEQTLFQRFSANQVDGLNILAEEVSSLLDQADTAVSQQWDKLFNK